MFTFSKRGKKDKGQRQLSQQGNKAILHSLVYLNSRF